MEKEKSESGSNDSGNQFIKELDKDEVFDSTNIWQNLLAEESGSDADNIFENDFLEIPDKEIFSSNLKSNNPFADKLQSIEKKSKEEIFEFADFSNFNNIVEQLEQNEEDMLEKLSNFHEVWNFDEGWKFLLRQPLKKKLAQNRFWKPAYVKLIFNNKQPFIKIYPNEKDSECLFELELNCFHGVCNLGLQQFDQYGKCHTVKIQQMTYKESIGLKADRITPTLNDLSKIRDIKSIKDLVHKPKTTMILDHSCCSTEILKFGSHNYSDIKSFINVVEDLLFNLESFRGKSPLYTKDEINIEVQDEYVGEIDKDGHVTNHKARVRLFCLAFLSNSPTLEIGINDKRRKGNEIVKRQDIIPIKTEEWIKIENYEMNNIIDKEEFDKSIIVKMIPFDACKFEFLRFRTRPKINIELPLQVRSQIAVVEKHIELRVEIMVTGYYSNSDRDDQTPCEDIQIRVPISEEWVYLFRVEKRFKYGSVHSTKRKAGKIKGLERLTAFAQGILPPSLIEVSIGQAKYEQAFHSIVWRIDQLPEKNEGAYKTHLMTINMELGQHDKMPETILSKLQVEYWMANSTVSKAQVRSVSVINGSDDPPDKWVKHLAKFEYTIESEHTDQLKPKSEDIFSPINSKIPEPSETQKELISDQNEIDYKENSSSDSD